MKIENIKAVERLIASIEANKHTLKNLHNHLEYFHSCEKEGTNITDKIRVRLSTVRGSDVNMSVLPIDVKVFYQLSVEQHKQIIAKLTAELELL